MARHFNGKEIELLAPCGNFEIFQDIVETGADAVYFGGKILNMRMHRKDYNFTHEEIHMATKMAHDRGKKVYITVNNLLNHFDLSQVKDFLLFLNQASIDGIIIQDMNILEHIKPLQLDYEIHSSVMMNVHNKETVKALKNLGVSRIVASRESSLKDIKSLTEETKMAFEYFTHGDMCIAHGAQCLYSGIVFGKSSNRGLCMKPCRWDFKIKHNGRLYPTEFPLAVKDMSMFENLPEMIDAGIVSFKIEGRMRDSNYLVNLINLYSNSIDRYISDPENYDRFIGSDYIYENRKRDLSTAYALDKPGLSNINRRYEGTGKFYSHGKVFSKPIDEKEILPERILSIREKLSKFSIQERKTPSISVKVNSKEHAFIAIDKGADAVYLSGEAFLPKKDFTPDEVIEILNHKKDCQIILGMPRMCSSSDLDNIDQLIKEVDKKAHQSLDGILITSLGAINRFSKYGIPLIGDVSLNIYNNETANFYSKQGLKRCTLSIEMPLNDLIETVRHSDISTELIVGGAPTVMYLEHDLYQNLAIHDKANLTLENNKYEDNKTLVLVHDLGTELPVYKSSNNRNHILTSKELCYIPLLDDFSSIGLEWFRVEGCHYTSEQLSYVLDLYINAIAKLTDNNSYCELQSLFENMKDIRAGNTLGALDFD